MSLILRDFPKFSPKVNYIPQKFGFLSFIVEDYLHQKASMVKMRLLEYLHQKKKQHTAFESSCVDNLFTSFIFSLSHALSPTRGPWQVESCGPDESVTE